MVGAWLGDEKGRNEFIGRFEAFRVYRYVSRYLPGCVAHVKRCAIAMHALAMAWFGLG
jgi:hypothetical protein